MRIRLIIPIREELEAFSEEAYDIEKRIKLLNLASIETEDDFNPELIITSHNFFAFSEKCIIQAHDFIYKKLISQLTSNIENKIPIILGVDILNKDIRFNPYSSGIDSIVYYIEPKNGIFRYKSHVWEVWEPEIDNISLASFLEQKNNRYISIHNSRTACLFSCGDIFQYTHQLQIDSANLYICLAHIDFGRSINRIKNRTIKNILRLSQQNPCLVIITQNISLNEINTNNIYFQEVNSGQYHYKFVFSLQGSHVINYTNSASYIESYSSMFVDLTI